MRVFIRWLTMAVLTGLLIPGLWLVSIMWDSKHRRETQTSPGFHSDGVRVVDRLAQDHAVTLQQAPTHMISPQIWRNHIQSSCRKLGFYKQQQELDPDIFKHSKILVDDENKLLYCQIPKVASTTWRRILIMLSGKVDVENPLSISANDAHHKYDKYLTYLNEFPTEEIVHRLNTYFKFVFVREPFERLLSAFRNKFVSTTNSSLYFKRVFGRKIIERYRENPPAVNTGSDLKFQEFVDYLIDPNKKIIMNEHWENFHKLCHPCAITYDYIGKLENIEEDSQYILDKNSLSQKIKVPSRSDSKYGHHKTHSYMKEYYSKIPKASIRKLYKMYFPDFLIFNYTVPESIKSLM